MARSGSVPWTAIHAFFIHGLKNKLVDAPAKPWHDG
jgi:hypothetical protein